MYEDIRAFVNECVHCVVYRTVEKIARPLALALHRATPNDAVHMDFLYIGEAKESDVKHVLIKHHDPS